MILVDTSVLLDQQRTNDRRLEGLLRTLPAAVCGPIRVEVLTGARTPLNRNNLVIELDRYIQLSILDQEWDLMGDLRAHLASLGVSVSLADATMADIAVINGIELWSRDEIHEVIALHIPALRLFQEPP